MDSMRSILMILGIVLHSANIFRDANWGIQDNQTSLMFDYLVDFIHLFRMPAFFIVSGFFCHMTLKKSTPWRFCNVRIPRIIIPLIVTIFTLNIMQNLLLTKYGTHSLQFIDIEYWIQGKWVSHLWFLICLVYYFVIAALLYEYTPKILERFKILLNFTVNKAGGLYIYALPILSILLIKISYLIPTVIESDFNYSLSESIQYSCYFIFGIILGTNKRLLKRFTRPSVYTTIICISLVIYSLKNPDSLPFVKLYTTGLCIWLLCSLCFHLFHTLLNRKSKFFTYLAEASYSIYLFHHILVVVYGILLIHVEINIYLKFLIIVFSTFITSNLIHYLIIRRYRIAGYLFNGRNHA